MTSFCDNFVNTSYYDSDEPSNSENFSSECTDPLQELGDEAARPKCRKIDRIVFAEPLKNISNGENCSEEDRKEKEEITFIDNVIIQKSLGRKYKKYYINVEDATNPRCPQSNCARTFSTTKLLKAHIRKVHCADKSKYVCEICGTGFSARYLLVRHTAVHSGEKVKCPLCSKLLSQRTSLSKHLRSHSGIRPHTCTICNKSFANTWTLAKHVKYVHRDPLACDQCDARFFTRRQWRLHMRNHRRK